MLRILSSFMMGFVCDLGPTFLMSLTIFFCIFTRGSIYWLEVFSVPQMVIAPIKCPGQRRPRIGCSCSPD